VALRFACERCRTWPPEEPDAAGGEDGRDLSARALRGDRREAVPDSSGSSAPATGREQRVAAVAGVLVDVGVDRLVLAAGGDPHAAVLGVGAIERHPRPDQRVGLRDDVERVPVVALARAARLLDELHQPRDPRALWMRA
jgi:hypothetical protein